MPQLNIKKKKKGWENSKRLTTLTYNAAISNIINNATPGVIYYVFKTFFSFLCV